MDVTIIRTGTNRNRRDAEAELAVADLLARWREVPVGGKLRLTWPT